MTDAEKTIWLVAFAQAKRADDAARNAFVAVKRFREAKLDPLDHTPETIEMLIEVRGR